jgi:hypothetical protein
MNTKAVLNEWTAEISKIGAIIYKLGNALILLKEKRCTVEDKIIMREFLELMAEYGQVLQNLPQLQEAINEHDLLDSLNELNSLMLEMLSEFLKIFRYDLNFFEQYYEYDFINKLKQASIGSKLSHLRLNLGN